MGYFGDDAPVTVIPKTKYFAFASSKSFLACGLKYLKRGSVDIALKGEFD
jgi:hypothetical protein